MTERANPLVVPATALIFCLLAAGPATAAATAPSANSSANNAVDLPENVTWSDQVAAIVHENCASCHRPDDIAPMSLLTYDEARPWAKSMLKAVKDGVMPPWHADRAHGQFANDRSLSEQEIALLERWVKKGAKPGDLTKAPQAPELSGGWRLGEPDQIVTFEQVDLPAGGPDVFEDLMTDMGLDEPRWLRAIEIKPGNRRVVHHVIMAASDGKSLPSSGWLGAWAAGMEPMIFPEGTAKRIAPGQALVADMHYHPTDEASTDQTQIGLYFYDGEPEKELINLWIQNSNFEIPAGDPNHVVRSTHTFTEDSTVYGLLPHMHYRGKEFTYTATYPDGSSEVLLHVPRYDFNWQTLYELEQPLKMPKGTRIDCVAHYDNSAKNPFNPDPTRNITFGPESYDEMMIGFVDYVVDQGQRPLTAEQQVEKVLSELAPAHPGEVFAVTVSTEGMEIPTALYLPRSGGDGVWHIAMIGQLMKGTLGDIVFDGNAYSAVLTAPFGTLKVEGTIAGDKVSGKVSMGDEAMSFAGHEVGGSSL